MSSKIKTVSASLGRLAIVTTVAFGVSLFKVYDRYDHYWGTTIYRVQTVDFNILSHTLATKLSYAILNSQLEEVQRTLECRGIPQILL